MKEDTDIASPSDLAAQNGAEELQSMKAYRAIRAAIAELRIRPGEPLSEAMLAERFNLGRMPIRAAVNRLCHDGFLIAVSRKGIFVNPLLLQDVREIYELLEAIDGMALRLAAARVSESDVAALEELVTAQERAIVAGDFEGEYRANRQFHDALVALAGNRRMSTTLELLEEQVSRATRLAAHLRNDPLGQVENHRSIVEALRDGDGERAVAIGMRHREAVRDEILSALSRINGVLGAF
jgi:DNA-binding GntR family transcriptional regulator